MEGEKDMEENVARILQMLQEGKINVQEATALIAAVRGEQAAPAADKPEKQEGWSEKRHGGPPPWFWLWFWLLCCRPCRCRR